MANSIVSDPGLVALLEAAIEAREQALALVNLAAENAASTELIPAGDAVAATRNDRLVEISRQQKRLTANIAQLRSLHRSACFSARDTKAQTAEARQEVDRLHLQLQNLYYEQRHLQGEIAACENYECVDTAPPLVFVSRGLAH